jgi:DNA-binding CsgD family transcriptional regulator
MGHLSVFAFLAIFICGFWTAVVIRQQYRITRIVLLGSLYWYVVSFNVLVFCFFVARYALTNLTGGDPATYNPIVKVGSTVLGIAVDACVVWTFLHLAWNLNNKTIPRNLRLTLLTVISLIGISLIIGSTVVLRGGPTRWIDATGLAMGVVVLLGYGYALLGLVAGRNTNLNAGQRSSARRFGWFLIGGFLFVVASMALPGSYDMVGFAVGLLWLSYAPMFWLRRYSEPYRKMVIPEGVSPAVAVIARRYGITRREQEIMALLVEGKSNKEIEDLLCISFSTVKNHVYNLYRKLDVSSRSQLMHLVMAARNRKMASPTGQSDNSHGIPG